MHLPDSDTTAYTGPIAPQPLPLPGDDPRLRVVHQTSRKLRRDSGDRRTVKQIMAEQRREGR